MSRQRTSRSARPPSRLRCAARRCRSSSSRQQRRYGRRGPQAPAPAVRRAPGAGRAPLPARPGLGRGAPSSSSAGKRRSSGQRERSSPSRSISSSNSVTSIARRSASVRPVIKHCRRVGNRISAVFSAKTAQETAQDTTESRQKRRSGRCRALPGESDLASAQPVRAEIGRALTLPPRAVASTMLPGVAQLGHGRDDPPKTLRRMRPAEGPCGTPRSGCCRSGTAARPPPRRLVKSRLWLSPRRIAVAFSQIFVAFLEAPRFLRGQRLLEEGDRAAKQHRASPSAAARWRPRPDRPDWPCTPSDYASSITRAGVEQGLEIGERVVRALDRGLVIRVLGLELGLVGGRGALDVVDLLLEVVCRGRSGS